MTNNLKFSGADILAVIIFITAVVVRAAAQYFTPPGVMSDYAWVTTFAVIAASWLSLGSRAGVIIEKVAQVQRQTNGLTNNELAEKIDEIHDVVKDQVN
jgi:hypothetical protein